MIETKKWWRITARGSPEQRTDEEMPKGVGLLTAAYYRRM